jgi:hypothetical protein
MKPSVHNSHTIGKERKLAWNVGENERESTRSFGQPCLAAQKKAWVRAIIQVCKLAMTGGSSPDRTLILFLDARYCMFL